ncbi:MAG: hypothetical protein KC486_30935, partial [Myxococcales bacterium]|nr:hypothetical protein [Myxococcales bacterium]
MLHRLGEPSPLRLQAKAANLDRLCAAGLPVPPGIVVELDPPDARIDPRVCAAIEGLLAQGPLIVRSALGVEDRARESGAGLGLSVGDCQTLTDVTDALRRIAAQRHAPWLADSTGARARAGDQAIIQRQVDAAELLVVAAAPRLAVAVEVYTPSDDALAGQSTPRFAGPLSRWTSPQRRAIEALVDAAGQALELAELDLEIVVDAADRPALVQARPLTRALQPGWEAFAAAVADAGDALPQGWWRLDAEHNPAPLSPAHAWLLEWLGARRPGTPRTLAGWLYEPLDSSGPTEPAAETRRFSDPQ